MRILPLAETDAKPPVKELLAEVAKLGVNITMLQQAELSEDELRGLLSGLKRLLRERKGIRKVASIFSIVHEQILEGLNVTTCRRNN